MSDDVLIRAEGVSKKFCRSLKRSLWYGVKDTMSDLAGRDGTSEKLRRDEFWAVNDVSFEIRRGESLGLIGRNGAGKTTLLKMLNGLIKPDCGRIEMHGRVGALIALGTGFNPILTGWENIYINGAVLGLSRKEVDCKISDIIDFAEIGDFIDAPVRNYSSGMNVRLGFAIATALEPDVLLIDEVLAVGDSQFRWKCMQRIKFLKESGVSIILVSHSSADLMRTCARGIVLQNGRARYDGSIADAVLSYDRATLQTSSGNRATQLDNNDSVKITGFRFRVNGHINSSMKAGDHLEIEMELNVSELVPQARVIVSFSHSDLGQLFALSSYLDNKWLRLEPGRTTVRLDLEYLPIQFGTYYAVTNIRGPNLDDIYCQAESDVSLTVIEPVPNYEGFGLNGVIIPRAKWKIEPKYESDVDCRQDDSNLNSCAGKLIK